MMLLKRVWVNLNFLQTVGMSVCERIAPPSARDTHFNISHFNSSPTTTAAAAAAQQQWVQHLAVLLGLWLHLHPVTTTASRN